MTVRPRSPPQSNLDALRLFTFGAFRIELAGRTVHLPRRKVEALLAYLVLHAEAHSRDKLAGLFWGDFSEAQARASLRNALAILRKELGDGLLLADRDNVQLNPDYPLWVDALEFGRIADLSPQTAVESLRSAIVLYQGDLLPASYDDWVILERERLLALFEQKMQQFLERLAQEQRWPEVLEWGERWIALGRTPEPAYCALMIAYANLGDRSKVSSAFRRCAEALRQDLGLEPSEPTRALHDQLAKGEKLSSLYLTLARRFDPQAIVEEEPPAPGESPYKGLQYFDEADADLFYGRELLIARLVGHLREHRFLAVIVGASGSGKSSLVRAGLVPALKRGAPLADGTLPPEGSQDWAVHIITPTAHPLEALAASLTPDSESATAAWVDEMRRHPRGLHLCVRRILSRGEGEHGSKGEISPPHPHTPAPQHLLLVVDQFEELFTLCQDEAERKAYVDNLLTATAPSPLQTGEDRGGGDGHATVVITLRADFYAHCAQYANLREAVAQHQEYIGPMNAEELRRAIEEPARRGGWEFEPGLVNLILRDVGAGENRQPEPGALPLLSHSLLETWKRRRGRMLTLKGYAESGGVLGAIAKTAERVFNQELTPEQQTIARRIFVRLTELGEGTEDTRRRAAHADFVWRPEVAPVVEAVLNILAEARLITLGEETAEVAHEALIREWGTLREWLTQNREGLRLHRHLTEAAQEWDELGRDPGALYRGARLAQTGEWAASNPDEVNVLERMFLEASQALAAQEEAEREAQRQRELAAARLAFARELAAASVSNLDVDPERSILLALQSVTVTHTVDKTWTPEAEAALHRAVETSRVLLTLRGHAANAVGVAFSPDGARLVTDGGDGKVKLWDTAGGRELLTLSAQQGPNIVGAGVAFSPDGKKLATASGDGRPKIWDTATGQPLLEIPAHSGSVPTVAFSPDGKKLATSSADSTAKVWDVATGQLLLTLAGHHGVVFTVAFNADGTRLVTASADKMARVWDAGTAKELLAISGHADSVRAAACSPDGARMATASQDATAKVWDATTGQPLFTLTGHASFVVAIAYNSDGTQPVTGSEDGTAKVWDAATGRLVLTLAGHTSGVLGATFSPNGAQVATTSRDTNVRVWDVSPNGGREWLNLAGHSDLVVDVAYSLDGTRLATASFDKTAKVWDAATGQELLALSGHSAAVQAVVFSPDSTRLATASDDGTAKVWHVATGQELLTLLTHTNFRGFSTHGLSFSPDGTRLATSAVGTTALIRDAVTGQELLTLREAGHTNTVGRVAFSPDGWRLATASTDGTAKAWEATTGQMLLTLSGHIGTVNGIAFSLDGTRLATAGNEGTVKVWDAVTGKEVFTLSGHQGPVFGVAFSPDVMGLATSSVDRTVKIWHVTPERE